MQEKMTTPGSWPSQDRHVGCGWRGPFAFPSILRVTVVLLPDGEICTEFILCLCVNPTALWTFLARIFAGAPFEDAPLCSVYSGAVERVLSGGLAVPWKSSGRRPAAPGRR